jgi:hypothetical protein
VAKSADKPVTDSYIAAKRKHNKFSLWMEYYCVLHMAKTLKVKVKVKVKESHYRPGVAHRVPGS